MAKLELTTLIESGYILVTPRRWNPKMRPYILWRKMESYN